MPTEAPSGLQFCIDWLDRNRPRMHSPTCRSLQPSAQCDCGFHRVMSELRSANNDLQAHAKPSSFQDRVRLEKVELDENLRKLLGFQETETFDALPVEEQLRLIEQSILMQNLSVVLGRRIAAFK